LHFHVVELNIVVVVRDLSVGIGIVQAVDDVHLKSFFVLAQLFFVYINLINFYIHLILLYILLDLNLL